MTDYCNYFCKNCYHSNKGSLISQNVLTFLSNIENSNQVTIKLLGGEPLSIGMKNLKRIYEYICNFKSIFVHTNGYFVTKEVSYFLKEQSIIPKFTLYSLSEKKHDTYTGIIGSFKKTTENIRSYFLNKSPYDLSLILEKDEISINHDQDIVHGARQIYKDIIRPNSLTDKDVIKDRFSMLKRLGKPIKYDSSEQILSRSTCHPCIKGKISISTDGFVYKCPWDRSTKLMHISEMDPQKIESYYDKLDWNKPMAKIYKACSVCEFRLLCNDCVYLNQTIFDNKNIQKPLFCLYDPFKGESNATRQYSF